jgi:hypothetical protein
MKRTTLPCLESRIRYLKASISCCLAKPEVDTDLTVILDARERGSDNVSGELSFLVKMT